METTHLLDFVQAHGIEIDSSTSKISEGILVVDKPSGVSSHRVVNWARKYSGIKKVGHTGTLDPLATGLLIVLVGRNFTKKQDLFLKQPKSYSATIALGYATDSYDVQGEITNRDAWEEVQNITQKELESAVRSCLGTYSQQVPIFSAVKVDGQKLYEVAHLAQRDPEAQEKYQKFMAQLPSREVEISKISLDSVQKDATDQKYEFSISVSCSSGTYIRSLAVDIGKKIGVNATVTTLRRTAIADISLENARICPFIHRSKPAQLAQ